MAADEGEGGIPKQVAFHYVKSSQFRVVHGDGIIGGVTPRGLIHFSVYSERAAIPQMVVNSVEPDGRIGKEIEQISRGGIVRELEMDVILDIVSAKSFRDWLSERILQVEGIQNLPGGPKQ